MKVIFYIIVLIYFMLLGSDSIILAQKLDKNLYSKLQSKLIKINSISFNFLSKEDPKYQGLVRAKRGNKYDVQTPIRRLICNGTTIWNYNEIEKKVVLSSYEEETGNSISIENLFFNIVQEFKPAETQFLNLNGKECYRLKLTPKNNQNSEYKSIVLYILKEDLSVFTVQIDSNDITQTWEISNLQINPKLPDKIFEFNVPEGTLIIDLR